MNEIKSPRPLRKKRLGKVKACDSLSSKLDQVDANRSAVHAACEGIISVNAKQQIVMVNPAAVQMFGFAEAQVIGQDLQMLIPPEQRAHHAEMVRAFLLSDQSEQAVTDQDGLLGLRANGDVFPISLILSKSHSMVERGQAKPLFTALVRDLSVEQGLRSELAGIKNQFRRLFELAPVAMLITEEEIIVFANRSCLGLLGAKSLDQVIGKPVYHLIHSDSHAVMNQQIKRAVGVAAGSLCTMTEKVTRMDGSHRLVEIAIATMPGLEKSTVQMVLSDVTLQEQESLELQQSRHELRRLSASLIDAREEERRRIARELHDELGQRLSALKMDLSEVGAELHGRASQTRVVSMLDMLDATMASVRHIAADLRPLMLDDLGLYAAIEWLAREFERRMGLKVTVRLGHDEPQMDPRTSTALYRMVQESLTNVARHAHATTVEIDLGVEGKELVLTVQDNGVGFAAKALRKEGSFGLLGMRERALLLEGQMQADNTLFGGRIRVRLPLPRQLPRSQLQMPTMPWEQQAEEQPAFAANADASKEML
ncbi:PAS domain S-box protein [Paucibacter sp. TC2R-5]|uniref:PAS domain-containing sensor histidine kinase n=1 Tax=Paucibacter sp. TC2R-5 TaxID=2893555 RepID=UPI0021E3FF58|nr:PAS domain S-box protein [Paucibacter sp. TC2R-5]MCV2358180.1 PAS domain S-box protein [Paucibacter sp. TC2R-5]